MKALVNGEQKEIKDGETLSSYIGNANYPVEKTIIELNGEIVGKDKWGQLKLADGDRIEIVAFVGGG